MLKTFEYRLYPSRTQARLLDQTLETCRNWYNTCLAERRGAWEQEQRSVGKFAQLAKVKDYRKGNPYAGRVPVRWHRPLEGQIKTVRMKRKAGKWYACFACEVEQPEPLPDTGQSVGIDVGITSLITTSDGEKIENPKWYRTEQRKLRVLQRRVARRKKGGTRRRKAVLALQRQHERIRNKRKDFLNKLVADLVNRYDSIAVEDLRISNMIHNKHLSKSILDAGWGYFRQRLSFKAEEAGRTVVEVNPANTSRTCSRCGLLFDGLTLADRWVECNCGLSLDRDHNAAINVLSRAGQVRQARTYPVGECVA